MLLALSASPMSSSVTSISMETGIFSGRARTGMRRKICWRMPPETRPLALPVQTKGTSTSTGWGAFTRPKAAGVVGVGGPHGGELGLPLDVQLDHGVLTVRRVQHLEEALRRDGDRRRG